MEKQAPSIFNDVIGPVMRGPSSSHVAGAARIGDLLRQMAEGDLKEVIVDFDVNGSLAESHEGHGTDMGFACGILGVPLTDPRVDRYEELVRESGIDCSTGFWTTAQSTRTTTGSARRRERARRSAWTRFPPAAA